MVPSLLSVSYGVIFLLEKSRGREVQNGVGEGIALCFFVTERRRYVFSLL